MYFLQVGNIFSFSRMFQAY